MRVRSGDEVLKGEGAEAVRRQPPVVTGKKLGVVIGAGTDAHRVSTANPFTVLQWFLDGKNAGGHVLRGPEETPGRDDALRFYTSGSAWFPTTKTFAVHSRWVSWRTSRCCRRIT